MLRRLNDVPEVDLAEVVRIASELHARDQAQHELAAHTAELLKAAEEVGLPVEYLERAAAILHERRSVSIEIQPHAQGWVNKTWICEFLGHEIRVENRWIRERLFVDSRLVDETHGLVSTSLKGTIDHGEGRPSQVRAFIGQSGVTIFCKIWVDSELIFASKGAESAPAVAAITGALLGGIGGSLLGIMFGAVEYGVAGSVACAAALAYLFRKFAATESR